jgi:hypothetical protein
LESTERNKEDREREKLDIQHHRKFPMTTSRRRLMLEPLLRAIALPLVVMMALHQRMGSPSLLVVALVVVVVVAVTAVAAVAAVVVVGAVVVAAVVAGAVVVAVAVAAAAV